MACQIEKIDGSAPDDVFSQMAEIHRQVIHEGFLSTLGDSFLTVLYRSLARSPDSFVLCAVEDGRVLGFIVGAVDTGAVYKRFAKSAGFKALTLLLPKLFSWARLKRVFETLLYPSRKKDDDLPEPEILNFCVRADTQGRGVGGALFRSLLEEFARRGIERIRIVTGEGQKSAQAFYESKGSVFVKAVEVHKGSASRVYVHETSVRS